MCGINRSSSTLLNLPVDNKSIKKSTIINTKNVEQSNNIQISLKDQKVIDKDLSKNTKSGQVNFVDRKNNSLTDNKIISAASKIITAEIGIKFAEKTFSKAVGKTVEKSALAIGGKILKSVTRNTVETAVMTIGEEVTLKALEKGAVKATQKGSSHLAKKLSGAVPVVGAIMEVGFTIYDAKYAYELSKDKSVSKISKAFAWATVGLDIVSTISTATGFGAPIGWAATGLSIGTAVLSDMLQ